MIHDLSPDKLNPAYDPARKPTPDSFVLRYDKRGVLVRTEDKDDYLPRVWDFDTSEPYIYLFSIGLEDFFLLPEAEDPDGYEYIGLRQLKAEGYGPKRYNFAALTGFQLANWYRDNKYCGTCGNKTVLSKTERAISCPHCGRQIYPRVIPACIIGVTFGDKILLIRYAHTTYKDYGLVAGFTEIGESLEETVAREVKEEVGLTVTNIRYYKSQPWGIVDDILSGFYCDVAMDADGATAKELEAFGREPITSLDDGELGEATWYERSKIPAEYTDYTLTNEMMIVFKNGEEPR